MSPRTAGGMGTAGNVLKDLSQLVDVKGSRYALEKVSSRRVQSQHIRAGSLVW